MVDAPRLLTPGQTLRKRELLDGLADGKEEMKNLREQRRKLAVEIEEKEQLRKELKGKLDAVAKSIRDIITELKSLS